MRQEVHRLLTCPTVILRYLICEALVDLMLTNPFCQRLEALAWWGWTEVRVPSLEEGTRYQGPG